MDETQCESRCPMDIETLSLGNNTQLCRVWSFCISYCTNWMNLFSTTQCESDSCCIFEVWWYSEKLKIWQVWCTSIVWRSLARERRSPVSRTFRCELRRARGVGRDIDVTLMSVADTCKTAIVAAPDRPQLWQIAAFDVDGEKITWNWSGCIRHRRADLANTWQPIWCDTSRDNHAAWLVTYLQSAIHFKPTRQIKICVESQCTV